MARLTTFSRFLITLAIVGAVVFALFKFFPQLKNWKDGKMQEITTTEDARSDNNSGGNQTTTTTTNQISTGGERVPFAYTPPAPVNGKLKGVVELGATGFNSFIIRVDAHIGFSPMCLVTATSSWHTVTCWAVRRIATTI